MNLYSLARPFLFALEAERAHEVALWALRTGLVRGPGAPDDPRLRVHAAGLDFPSPLGLAAGFDKNARAVDRALGLGFGFVEVGAVTPRAQAGNPRPRLFRLAEDRAVINRFGFNNEGLAAMAARLAQRAGRGGIVGVNLGANKDSEDKAADYVAGLQALYDHAQFFTVNVSSPNTAGLRDLQTRAALDRLLGRVLAARDRLADGSEAKPLLVKIAPDLDPDAERDVAETGLARAVDGLIVSNTTLARPANLRSRAAAEAGGLSGAPLFAPSTALLRRMAERLEGRLTLIGAGGIASAEDAYAKIRAGASLVQLYSAMVYEGPGLPARINAQLPRLLEADGHSGVSSAIGADIGRAGA